MKDKNGFTLTEVLATIVVLGIIAVIIYPKVIDTINDSKKNSYLISTNNLVEFFSNYALDKKANLIEFSGCEYDFDSNQTDCEDIQYSGKMPSGGYLEVDTDGYVDGTVSFDNYFFEVRNGEIFYLIDH